MREVFKGDETHKITTLHLLIRGHEAECLRSYGVKLLNGCAGGLGNSKGTFVGCQEADSRPVEAMGGDLHIRNLWYGISISFHGCAE